VSGGKGRGNRAAASARDTAAIEVRVVNGASFPRSRDRPSLVNWRGQFCSWSAYFTGAVVLGLHGYLFWYEPKRSACALAEIRDTLVEHLLPQKMAPTSLPPPDPSNPRNLDK
jgi:hypothetical protein